MSLIAASPNAGETVTCEPRTGLICKDSEQSNGDCRTDYRVRFLCPQGTIEDTSGISCNIYVLTSWLNRDDPTGQCDCETLEEFSSSLTCSDPAGVRCRERSTEKDYQDVGQTMTCNARVGGQCWNKDNNPPCKNYEVQFICKLF